jgi:hypothetical protein
MTEQEDINKAEPIGDSQSRIKTTSPTYPGYLEVIGIACLIALAVAWGYDHFFAPQIKTFDLKGYLREQTALIQAGAMTEEQFKAKLDKMEAALDAEKSIILLKDVVVRGGEEIPAKQ